MQFNSKWLTVALAVLPAFLSSSGCSSSRHGGDEHYYLIASNIKLPYWQAAAAGLDRAARELKVRTEMVGPETYNPTEQRDHFRNVVARKPSGILVSVANPDVLKAEINAAVAAGIPVVTMDSDAPGSNRLFFIGTNNYQAGVMGGRLLVRQLGGKGNVVVLTIPAQANLVDRLRGYEDAIAGSGVKIVSTVDIKGNPAVAFDATGALLADKKMTIDGFVCLEATACKEVADVLNRNQVQGKTIIAMDTDEGTLDWIEKGSIAATIGQKPFTMAYFGVRMLDELHHNKPNPLSSNWAQNLHAPVPSVVDTGAALIDKANLQMARSTGGTAEQK